MAPKIAVNFDCCETHKYKSKSKKEVIEKFNVILQYYTFYLKKIMSLLNVLANILRSTVDTERCTTCKQAQGRLSYCHGT